MRAVTASRRPPQGRQPFPRLSGRRPWAAAAACMMLAAAAVNIWFAHARTSGPSYDDAWYLEISYRLYHALAGGDLAGFIRTYTGAFRFKAPLISLLPLPFYALLGPGMDQAAAAVTAAWLAAGLFVFKLAARRGGPRAGFLAAAAYAAMPLGFGLSRLFFVETLLTALTAAWLFLLLEPDGMHRRRVGLGIVLGLGLLTKVLFPLFAFPPALLLLLRRREEPRRRLPDIKRILAIGGAIALSWYAFNWITTAGYAYLAGFGRIAKDYHSGSALSAAAEWSFLRQLVMEGVGLPCAVLSALLLADALRRRLAPGLEAAALGSVIAVPLLLLLAGVNKEIRFLAPALPAAAVLLGTGAARWTRGSTGRGWILAGLAFGAAAIFAGQTFGFAAPFAYNGPPPSEGNWRQEELVRTLAGDISPNGGAAVVAVGVEHEHLNANNLAAIAARENLPLSFTSLGYAQEDVHGAWIRIQEKRAAAIVLVSGFASAELPGFLNRANDGVREALRRGAWPFERAWSFELRPGLTAEVYRRRR